VYLRAANHLQYQRNDFSDKKSQKSDFQFTKSDFFPIEKAAIVSLSNANRQEYEHLHG